MHIKDEKQKLTSETDSTKYKLLKSHILDLIYQKTQLHRMLKYMNKFKDLPQRAQKMSPGEAEATLKKVLMEKAGDTTDESFD